MSQRQPRSEERRLHQRHSAGIADPVRKLPRLVRRERRLPRHCGSPTRDVVLIAGKGHEDYQIFADRTIHFSDQETAAAVLRRRA